MRRGTVLLVFVSLLCLGMMPSTASADILYYNTVDLAPALVTHVYSVDTITQISAPLMDLPGVFLLDLAGSGLPGVIYGADIQNNVLILINVQTKTWQPVGTQFDATVGILSLAYDRNHNILYGCTYTDLYIVDTGTGAVINHIGSFGFDPNSATMPGLGYDQSTNVLYGAGGTTFPYALCQINTSTGLATLVGTGFGSYVTDLYVSPDNSVMYGVISDTTSDLAVLDKLTGTVTSSFPVIGTSILGLAAPFVDVASVPAMTSLGLVIFCLIILATAVIVVKRKKVA